MVESLVDPRILGVNNRYRTNAVTPKDVRAEQLQLALDVSGAVRDQGFVPGKCHRAFLVFTVPNRRSDLDGPIKRVLDAIQDGIRMAGYRDFNDNSFEDIHIYRKKGEPQVSVRVVTLPEGQCFGSS